MTNAGIIGLGGAAAPSLPLPQGPQARQLASALAGAFAPPAAGTIDGTRAVFLGDSLTQAGSLANGATFDAYPTHLMRAAGGKVQQSFNGGHGGWTSQQLIRMLDAEAWSQNPSVVFLLPGRNDNLNEGDALPRETFDYLEAVRFGCALRGIPLILIGQPPNGIFSLGTPSAPTLTASTTGGTLTANTYRYQVSWSSGVGETLPSASASVTTTGTTSSVRIDMPVNTAAATYKIYKETTPGSGTYALVATLSGGSLGVQAAKSWTDTGAVTPSGAVASSDGSALPLDASQQRKQGAINLALAQYARKWGLLFADIWGALVDPATGRYTAGYSGDGVHPSNIGWRILGETVWAQVSSYFRPAAVVRPHANVDASNRVSNPLLMTGTGSPTSWTQTVSTGFGIVTPTLAPVTGFNGQGFTIGLTDGVSASEWTSPATGANSGDTYTAVNNGDIIEWSCRVAITGATAGGGSFYVNVVGSDGNVYQRTGFATDASGLLTGRFNPSGGGNVNFKFVFGVRNGPITATIGELALVNITRTKNL